MRLHHINEGGIGLRLMGSGSLPNMVTVTGETSITNFSRGGVNYSQILWRTSGSFTLSNEISSTVGLQAGHAVGSGGCGGRTGGTNPSPGGGGSGVVVDFPSTLPAGSYNITIGVGGVPGALNAQGGNGNPSTVTGPVNISAPGGGGGGGTSTGLYNGLPGGSGGGAGGSAAAGIGGVGSHGGNGGSSVSGAGTTSAGGGGGGADGNGQNGVASNGGDGGPGIQLTWTEDEMTVSGGGGGSNNAGNPGSGGSGGGTSGQSTVSATNGSGSGGTSGGLTPGNGGNGLVVMIVRSDEVIIQ